MKSTQADARRLRASLSEFAVAIRCGVISGKEAFIYAGAGIVADSDPDAEYREAELKSEPLLKSIGVESEAPRSLRE